MPVQDQLNRLRTAIGKTMSSEESSELSAIEARIKLMEGYEKLSKTPAISDLLTWMKNDVRGINERLATDWDLAKDQNSGTRLALFERKDFCYSHALKI